MSPWVLRGLREGVVSTSWPARTDEYASEWRGPATVIDPHPRDAVSLTGLCPVGAIAERDGNGVVLDQGRCILCGRCIGERPDVFGWSSGAAGAAAITRRGLIVPAVAGTDAELGPVRAGLARRTAALRRSVHLRHVDAGSDGSEEHEILALLNPVYDINRLGIFLTASPRHADVLLVTGAGAHGMAEPLRRTFTGMPDPKIVIAVGTDAVSGGLLGGSADGDQGPQPTGSYATSGGIGALVPVDVWVPGSPPPPFAILHGLLAGLGRLPAREEREGDRS
ncbi:MAG: hypothetical protein ACR2FU_03185 [Streptosporangiaceae bacterium]